MPSEAVSSVPKPQDCGVGILASEADRMSGENEREGAFGSAVYPQNDFRLFC